MTTKICKTGRDWGHIGNLYDSFEYRMKQSLAKGGDGLSKRLLREIRKDLMAGEKLIIVRYRPSKFHPNSAWGKFGREHKGSNHPCWKNGVTPVRDKIRKMRESQEWRLQVYQRDDFTCVNCGETGRRLVAHHIKPFGQILDDNLVDSLEKARECQELWEVKNGVTLCKKCHTILHTKGGN